MWAKLIIAANNVGKFIFIKSLKVGTKNSINAGMVNYECGFLHLSVEILPISSH